MHVLDRAYPKLFGDFNVTAVDESFELISVVFEKVVNFVRVEIHSIAEVKSFPIGSLLVLDQR